jgi:hypothetical protein
LVARWKRVRFLPAKESFTPKHADFCPVARTIKGCVDISTELQMEDA